MLLRALVLTLTVTVAQAVQAQEAESPMTATRLVEILVSLDPETRPSGSGYELTIEDIPVLVIMDPAANRMRAMVSIRDAADMSEDVTGLLTMPLAA